MTSYTNIDGYIAQFPADVQDFLAQGVIVDNGSDFVFTQDQVFNSPSKAAGAIQGRTANGRKDWRNSDGNTLKELQEVTAKEDIE